MTQEEKAKLYDELKVKAQELAEDGYIDKLALVDMFPELKESKDEGIRQLLISFVKYDMPDNYSDDFSKEDCLAWLEKQKGAKVNDKEISNPAWSEEDEDNMMMIEDRLSDYLDYIREDTSLTKHQKNSMKEEVIGYDNWLKSLKERVQFQPTWKPSDEQLECLGYAIEKAEKDWSPLTNNRIYLTLKALKEQLLELRGSKV